MHTFAQRILVVTDCCAVKPFSGAGNEFMYGPARDRFMRQAKNTESMQRKRPKKQGERVWSREWSSSRTSALKQSFRKDFIQTCSLFQWSNHWAMPFRIHLSSTRAPALLTREDCGGKHEAGPVKTPFIFGALFPSKSGLIHKHIVKHRGIFEPFERRPHSPGGTTPSTHPPHASGGIARSFS